MGSQFIHCGPRWVKFWDRQDYRVRELKTEIKEVFKRVQNAITTPTQINRVMLNSLPERILNFYRRRLST